MITTDDAGLTIGVGDHFAFQRVIAETDVDAFAHLSGDINPLHTDEKFAANSSFKKRVVHGMLVAGIASRLVGMHLPGTGSLWAEQELKFKAPVFIGDALTFSIEIIGVSTATRTTRIRITVRNQDEAVVLTGEGLVMLLEQTKDREVSHRQCSVGFVSGASRGIGRAIARKLALGGIAVGVNYNVSAEAAEDLVSEIRANGGLAVAVAADVSDADQVRAAIESCAEALGGPVDLLVCNAGPRIVPKPVTELTWQDYEDQLRVHLRGAYNCVDAVVPQMISAGFGKMIFVSSLATWNSPAPNMAHYTAAKHAVLGLMKSLAVELGPKGIGVNAVSPGMTDTELMAHVPDRLKKIVAAQAPLRRLGTPEDVADVVAFLSSQAASYLHGCDIPVAGGMAMR